MPYTFEPEEKPRDPATVVISPGDVKLSVCTELLSPEMAASVLDEVIVLVEHDPTRNNSRSRMTPMRIILTLCYQEGHM